MTNQSAIILRMHTLRSAIAFRERVTVYMDIEEILTVGADRLTQASLCLGPRVAPGVDPVPVVLDEVSISGL